MSLFPSPRPALSVAVAEELCARQTTHTCLDLPLDELGQRDMSTGYYSSAWNNQNALGLDENAKEAPHVPVQSEPPAVKHHEAKVFLPQLEEATEWYVESEGASVLRSSRVGEEG